MGKLDKAIGQYKEALRVKPDFYYAYWELAYVYALKEDYARAMQWIQDFIKHAPSIGTKSIGRQWRCFYLFWQARFDDALAEARRLRDMADDARSEVWNAEASRLEGWIHLARGDSGRSRDCFGKCMDSLKDHEAEYVPVETSYSLWTPDRIPRLIASYAFALGLVGVSEGDMEEARSRLEEMGDLFPDYALLLRAEILLADKDYDGVLSVCEKREPRPIPYMSDTDGMLAYNLPPLRDVLARALLAKGETGRALAEYARLARFDPRKKSRQMIHPTCHLNLAGIYGRAGVQERARDQMRKYHDIVGDDTTGQ